jgi:hypothetical protein
MSLPPGILHLPEKGLMVDLYHVTLRFVPSVEKVRTSWMGLFFPKT